MITKCPTCREIKRFEETRESEWFYSKTGFWYIGLNPKHSPYLGRTFAVTARHLGHESIMYGLGTLTDSEALEQPKVEKAIRRAIISAFDEYGLERIDGYTKMDSEHSSHPDRDLVPHYAAPFVFDGLLFGDEEQDREENVLLRSNARSLDLPLKVREVIKTQLLRQLWI